MKSGIGTDGTIGISRPFTFAVFAAGFRDGLATFFSVFGSVFFSSAFFSSTFASPPRSVRPKNLAM